jgi:hypothetical protein
MQIYRIMTCVTGAPRRMRQDENVDAGVISSALLLAATGGRAGV